jgi:hypothetical protein
MMMRTVLAASLAAGSSGACAATLSVGAGKTYATLAAAAAKANPGDTIVVSPGVYTSGAIWSDSGLTIRAATGAAPGSVIVRGGTVGGKALFVTKGDNITVQGIRFEGARVADGNGAGIRSEGRNLTVINAEFVGNEMGILATGTTNGNTLTVRGSRFDNTKSKRTGSIGHALYVGNTIDGLVVESSTFTRSFVGHYIKSRARTATITDNRIDDTNGTASYLIDLSEGGGATIASNVLVKGAKASNCCTAIAYGFEMKKGATFQNPAAPVRVTGNSFTNLRASNVTFFANRSTPANPVSLSGNTMTARAGSIRLYSGPVSGTPSEGALGAGFGVEETGMLVAGELTAFPAVFADYRGAAPWPAGTDAAAARQDSIAAFADRALAVPEAGIFALFGLGLAGIIASRARRGGR